MAPQARGPAASPPHGPHPPASDPSNPYSFPAGLWHAGKLSPKVTPTHVFFFGYEGDEPEVCFQQWFACPFVAPRREVGPGRGRIGATSGEGGDAGGAGKGQDEVEFPTSEHYMMYQKALLMGDVEIAEQIVDMRTNSHPSRAKALGRQVKGFDLELWTKHADEIVEEGNWWKFSQNRDLGEVLLATGEREIVEASPDDRIWGIGFNSEEAEGREKEWGNNGLGKALMRVRERLKRDVHA